LTNQSFNITLLACTTLLALSALTVWCQNTKGVDGQTLYAQHCSRCHGMKGGGGEGPALNRYYLPRASNDTAFANIIMNGIAGTSMPATWALSDKQIAQLIHFVRGLSENEEEEITGDPVNGLVLMEKSGCFSCHVIGAKGVSIGPDLASIGLRRGSAYLREAINNPGKQKILDENGFISYLVVDATLQSGKTITGVRINEDTFTLQMKDAENHFYSFRKSEVRDILRRKEASLMPSFSDILSAEETEDIIAYLMNLK
jgi:cytochrome c oxidase cbb3-type subunit 3